MKIARLKNRPFQEILQYYGMERFLYRLAESRHKNLFILKGALLFHVWELEESRATRDIDMLAKTDNSLDSLISIVKELCELEVKALDGVVFDSSSVSGEMMQIQREYIGARLRFIARLEKTRIPLQIDLGFGDIVTPSPMPLSYPVFLDLPAPKLTGYPVETVLAEKLHTMAEKGLNNSRVKDFYDVWILFRWRQFDPSIMMEAIKNTFRQRGSDQALGEVIQIILAYGTDEEKQRYWKSYRDKNSLNIAPKHISELCKDIAKYLQSILE